MAYPEFVRQLLSSTCEKRRWMAFLMLFLLEIGLVLGQTSHLKAYANDMQKAEQLFEQDRNLEAVQLSRIIAARVFSETMPSSNPAFSEIQLWLGHRYLAIGQFKEAENAYKSALDHRTQFQPKDHLGLAEANFALALVFLQLGNGNAAEIRLNEALNLQSKVGFGPAYCKSLEQLAGLQLLSGQSEDAKRLYERLLVLQDSLEGPNSPNLARTLNNLGGVYTGYGLNDKAKAVYEQAVNIQQQASANIELSTTLTNLGVLYDEIDDYPRALDYLKRAFNIRKEKLPISDPMRLNSLDNLISLMVKHQEYEAAIALLSETKLEREAKFGSDSPYVAEILDRFATYALAREDGLSALAYFRKALQIRENSLGAESDILAANLYNLGKLENLLGQTEQARIHLNWALDNYETQSLGNESQITAILSELFLCDYIQGKLDDAEKSLELMRAIKTEVYGPSHQETLAVLEQMYHFYSNTGRPEIAENYLNEILKMETEVLGN